MCIKRYSVVNLVGSKGQTAMKKEKTEKERIVILDNGTDPKALMGPRSYCCGSVLMPFRW